jgi:hypothetical protein
MAQGTVYSRSVDPASPKPPPADDWDNARKERVRFFVRQLAETLETLATVRRERDIARRQVRDLRAGLATARGAA